VILSHAPPCSCKSKEKEKEKKRNINNDLAVLPSHDNIRMISSYLARKETINNFWPLWISSHGKKEIWFVEVSANGHSILE